ncbi:type II secretion system protein F [Coriobacteriaceae bacterium BV3Ac1]|nr:type II secretion system protein F [Coriobacteriaceae bacterium BV3Ac1]
MATYAGLALCASCGILTWAASFVLIDRGNAQLLAPASIRLRVVWRLFVHVCDICSQAGLVPVLLKLQAWRAASDVLACRLSQLKPLLSREQACAALLLADCAAAFTCLLFSRSLVGMSVPVFALAAALPIWNAACRRKREIQLAKEMPDALRALALALSSGETLSQAIDYVGSHGQGPTAEAFSRVAMRLRCGDSVQEALCLLEDELVVPRMGLVITALLVSQRTGSPLRSLLQTSAELAEKQGELERLLAVKTAQVRLSVRIVCLLPLTMVALLSLLSPDFQVGLSTPAGAGSVIVALLMDGLALFIVRRLMKGVI